MIVNLEKNKDQKGIEVLIKYAKMNQTVKRLERILKSTTKTIKCNSEEGTIWINVSDIYYIESVDKHTFVYCEKLVYQTDLRLYQLTDEFWDTGFVRVSKSCIVNIDMLECIRPLLNSRMEATLLSGERINVTRKYLPFIRKKLQER